MDDRARLEQFIAETRAEIAAMKAIVESGVGSLNGGPAPRSLNDAFRRIIELGPQLMRAQAQLDSVTEGHSSRLTLRRHGYGYAIEGLPEAWAAQLTPERDRWILIVKRQNEPLWSSRFMTPFDALTALQSEVDPTMCLVRDS